MKINLTSIMLLALSLPTLSHAQFMGEINLSIANVVFVGEDTSDQAGYHISIAGDVNDDDYDDILIAAPFNSEAGKNAGQVYLVLGRPDGWSSTINLKNADASFLGESPGHQASHDVFGLGDINNDGVDDFGIGVKNIYDPHRAGKVYIFFGKKNGWAMDMPITFCDASFIGEAATSEAAHIMPVGDINGDEIDDFIIGAGFYDQDPSNLTENTGKVYVIFGKETGWDFNVNLADADASFVGEFPGDWAGHRVAGVGDVNSDGLNDFIVGANNYDEDGVVNRGKAYLILGKTSEWVKNTSFADADVSFLGPSIWNAGIGWNVCGPGDVNGDGIHDILIGGQSRSKIFLVLGKKGVWKKRVLIDAEADAVFSGENLQDRSGFEMRTLGDINFDGKNDFIIGAFGNDEFGNNSGKTYMILGRASWPNSIDLANSDATFLAESEGDSSGFSVAGGKGYVMAGREKNGDINGDGYSDLLISAPRNDDGAPNAGKVYLFFGSLSELIVTQPNGNEVWDFGKSYRIKWYSANPQGNVRIELSLDSGTSWIFLKDTTDIGDAWLKIDNSINREMELVLTDDHSNAVEDEDWQNAIDGDIDGWDGTVTDESNPPYAVFEFADSQTKLISRIRLLTDTGVGFEERWTKSFHLEASTTGMEPGDFTEILRGNLDSGRWQDFSFDSQPARYIKLTIDEPTQGYRQLGEFKVFGSTNIEESDRCLIKITHLDIGAIDQSNREFSIVHPNLTVTAPNGRENWPASETKKITWESLGDIPKVKIQYSIENGNEWITIADSTVNTGNYAWTVPVTSSTQCLVQIQDARDGQPIDVSDAAFEISEQSIITIITPTGGENWEIDTQQEITWNSINAGEQVKIELSRDNGSSWETIADSISNTNSWLWTVTGPPSETCLLRISNLNGSPVGVCNSPFSIHHPASVDSYKSGIPKQFALLPNYPNPFSAGGGSAFGGNPETRIKFQLPKNSYVIIAVYNVVGHQIRVLVDENKSAGHHNVVWNGKDDSGRLVPSGIYFCRFSASRYSGVNRMLLLR